MLNKLAWGKEESKNRQLHLREQTKAYMCSVIESLEYGLRTEK